MSILIVNKKISFKIKFDLKISCVMYNIIMVNHYLIRCKDDKTLFEIYTNATKDKKRENLKNNYREIPYKSPITYEPKC